MTKAERPEGASALERGVRPLDRQSPRGVVEALEHDNAWFVHKRSGKLSHGCPKAPGTERSESAKGLAALPAR